VHHGADRPAGGQAAIDRLDALDDRLASLLSLAPVVAKRLQHLERGVPPFDPRHPLLRTER
jgi:hypothetical protein